MNIDILKKIFTKQQAITLLQNKKPELFGKKSKRCKKETYLYQDLYLSLTEISTECILEYTRNYSINNIDGKYYFIHHNLEYVINTIKVTSITKKDSPCHPENFSETIVKPKARNYIQEKSTEDINKYVDREIVPSLILHMKERINQQLKADYSEYLILMNCDKVIPTLKHTKGDDMYLLNENNEIEKLNIKTTRNIWGIQKPEQIIQKLYENQGKERFEDKPRLYIFIR